MMETKKETKEPQYQIQVETMEKLGPVLLGPTTSHLYRSDPRHLGFLLARYKFCSKVLSGKNSVVEVGSGDGFGSRVVLQEVQSVHGLDFDPLFVEWANDQAKKEGIDSHFSCLDIIKDSIPGTYDAAYSLDLIEHIEKSQDHVYMQNICNALKPEALCIIGTPNVTASPYASKWSVEGHINLKSADELKELMSDYFHNVVIFSMNDEVVHTGYYPMAHYLFGVGSVLKEGSA
jgi:2-polyprenyl-3-methyl-5-hydroxy-6-metoxy-1,4-benzoquinol methylase